VGKEGRSPGSQTEFSRSDAPGGRKPQKGNSGLRGGGGEFFGGPGFEDFASA